MVDAGGSVALTPTEGTDAAPGSVWQVRDALAAVDVGTGIASTVWARSVDGVS
jgi:hypothetical protein